MDPPYQPFKSDSEEPFTPSVQNPLYGCGDINLEPNTTSGNTRVRLRAIESESDYFLKSLNTTILRTLCLVQVICSILIIICQVLLYATVTNHYYKAVDYIGIGLWAPILFFLVAVGLSYLSTRKPTGCIIGTAMGLQITSAIVGCILLLLSVISLIMHGRYSYRDETYDPEVPGRVFCSLMILCAACEIITAIFISIHFCRSVCCGRTRMIENVLFDVETVK